MCTQPLYSIGRPGRLHYPLISNRSLAVIVVVESRLVPSGAFITRAGEVKEATFREPPRQQRLTVDSGKRASFTTRLKAAAALRPGKSLKNRGEAPADSSPARPSPRGERRGSGGAGTQSGPTARVWAAQRWSSMCLEGPSGWIDRRYRPGPNREDFGAGAGNLRHIPGPPRSRPTTGERPPVHVFYGPPWPSSKGENRHRRPRPAFRHCHNGGLHQGARERQSHHGGRICQGNGRGDHVLG